MAHKKKAKRPEKQARPARASWVDSRAFPWLLAAVYLVVLLVLFSDFVFSDEMLYGSDTLQAQVYMKDLHKEHFRLGDFLTLDFKPKWSPYLFGGMPFVDSFNSDLLNVPAYPFKFLLPIKLYRALGWLLILHFWLAGMGMYWAARKGWGFGRLPSAVAGLAYMLAPYLISMVHPGHDGKIFVTSWFPIGFLFLKQLWDHAQLKHIGAFALVVGIIILTPHVQMAYFSLWGYAAYSAYRLIRAIIEEKRVPWAASLGALAAVFIAVGMSAWQFFPGYNYVKNHSPRAGEGRGFEYATSWSLHPEEIVGEVVPDFAGVAGERSNTYWGRNYFKDNSEYGGLVALLLAVYAVFATRFRDRWFFFGLGVFAALYGLGAHTPLFTLFYNLVPNVKQMRAPSMIMFLYLFSICICAAAALQAFLATDKGERHERFKPKLLWVIAAVLGGFALLISIAPSSVLSVYTSIFYSDIAPDRQQVLQLHLDTIVLGFWLAALLAGATAYLSQQAATKRALWAVLALGLLIVLDNGRMDRAFIRTVDYNRYFQHDPVVDFLKEQEQPLRVLPVPGGFPTNYFALKRIPEMTGYHGNQLRTYNAFLGGSDQPRALTRQGLDLASVSFLIFRRGANLSGDPQDPTLQKVYDRGNTVAFRNLGALPWVRLVSCWEQHDPADSLYERLWSPDFDYRNCVIVDSPLDFESRSDSLPPGQATILLYENETIEIETQSDSPALLVVAENVYPAWHATVDDEPVEIVTTNATFRGVPVPAGTHKVEFCYDSPQLRAGARISLLSVILALILVGLGLRPRRRQA
jgi:hypothetical protein